MKQPELLTEWRTPYYGHAQTVTGDVWYEEDEAGKRTLLQPDIPIAGATNQSTDSP